ncbi:MAG TPA: YHS domain-containing (seleno)protein [Verrucomicrobiae bacterium]
MKKFLLLFLALGLVLPVFAQTDKTLVNTDKHGLALQGYDPVAFFTDNKPVKGTADFQSTYHGGTYYFVSAEHKASFDASPEKYEPAFGGYCAYGVSKGHLAPVSVQAFQIVDGRLLMQHSERARDGFNQDQKGNLAKAELSWPNLVGKDGK